MLCRFLKLLKKILCLLFVFCQNNRSFSLLYALSDITQNHIVSHKAGTDQRISLVNVISALVCINHSCIPWIDKVTYSLFLCAFSRRIAVPGRPYKHMN